MITTEQITAALKKLGPASPTAIAGHLQAEPSAIGYHLRKLLAAGELQASGTSNNRIYGLPGQKLEGAISPPPQKREKKTGKRRKAQKARTARAAAPLFIPAVDVESRLVIVTAGAPQIFNEAQTVAIATLLANHYGD